MGSRHLSGLTRSSLLCAVAVALSAGGCSTKPDASSGGDAKVAEPASLQRLAEQTGCSLTGQRKVADLEQGNCKNARGRYVLLSFTTEKGMNTWLHEARPWGGTYLVGARWIAVSTDRTLETLRKDLGGEIVHGDGHGTGGGASHGTGHG
ncbi:hypothetical protein BZB76_2986 [Actinomadura pelletieri DSM 43383]|uniref:Lipoprotein n=1 Tax=Actinomadura pelletieri DSM 43383 TaxID=1120940 RepID=A0A495QNP5_9ACTN|nr:hypothetical protein [Actinomadura pelletieri]RKS74472.1 hypothetical protein BZB76_2986 [Actinomadura pelletieri DSM 43383]